MFCLEHRIQSDEKIVLGKIIGGGDDCFNIFFSEIGKWIHVVRSVFFDLEHDVVDEVEIVIIDSYYIHNNLFLVKKMLLTIIKSILHYR